MKPISWDFCCANPSRVHLLAGDWMLLGVVAFTCHPWPKRQIGYKNLFGAGCWGCLGRMKTYPGCIKTLRKLAWNFKNVGQLDKEIWDLESIIFEVSCWTTSNFVALDCCFFVFLGVGDDWTSTKTVGFVHGIFLVAHMTWIQNIVVSESDTLSVFCCLLIRNWVNMIRRFLSSYFRSPVSFSFQK